METNSTKQKIIDLLKTKEITNFRGGIQLFADQKDKDWSISVNYNGTGLHIPKNEVNEAELVGDETIQICKSWSWRG